MRKRTIIGIIIAAFLSLTGIIITQLFWIERSYELKEEQFNNAAIIGLKSVVNQLVNTRNDSIASGTNREMTCYTDPVSIFDVLDRQMLDSLIQDEFKTMKIRRDFVYGVFKPDQKKFVMGPYEGYREELTASPHVVSLSCLCRADPAMLSVYFPHQKSMIFNQLVGWLLLSVAFLIVFIFAFLFSIWSIFRQKRLSQMKSDFVNNMTHEFKTPISTISLASEMLLKPLVYKSSDRTKKYAHIIYDENLRLRNQVEQVLTIAVLDKGEFKLRRKEIDVHSVLQEVCESYNLIVKDRKGEIFLKFEAKESVLYADKLHIANVFSNLIDNANKYSPEKPQINISTRNENGGVVVSVEDSGIGISKENQKHIFKKLFRIPTGNIHNVKGFGLGLYYVKTMVEAHGGSIFLESEVNKGSRFEIFFPFDYTYVKQES